VCSGETGGTRTNAPPGVVALGAATASKRFRRERYVPIGFLNLLVDSRATRPKAPEILGALPWAANIFPSTLVRVVLWRFGLAKGTPLSSHRTRGSFRRWVRWGGVLLLGNNPRIVSGGMVGMVVARRRRLMRSRSDSGTESRPGGRFRRPGISVYPRGRGAVGARALASACEVLLRKAIRRGKRGLLAASTGYHELLRINEGEKPHMGIYAICGGWVKDKRPIISGRNKICGFVGPHLTRFKALCGLAGQFPHRDT
jgi:hypothetical protein